MIVVPKTFRCLYDKFVSGVYAIRRTDNHWCALESDTAIECLLMRSIKSRTGLTRGSGMTEFRRNVWLGSAPVVAAVREDVRILTGVQRESSEQHKECGKSRMSVDKAVPKTAVKKGTQMDVDSDSDPMDVDAVARSSSKTMGGARPAR